jgi:RNA polymerase sigma factor (TIGR02999 family)
MPRSLGLIERSGIAYPVFVKTGTPLPPPGEVTLLLRAWSVGDEEARDRLMPFVYQELRRRAASYLRREPRNPTLQPTELVHETYLRLSEQSPGWRNRDQFYAVACQVMRRILVDRARARNSAKRGGKLRVTLRDDLAARPAPAVDLLALDEALEELAALDPRQQRLVELRFFTGLSLPEAAGVLGISLATANRDWAMAKAWLYRRMKVDEG